MKIYQAVQNPYMDANQYVMTLMDGIDTQFDDVEWGWGLEKFWQNEIFEYDIIHIQWSDLLLWPNRTSRQLEHRLSKLKENGKKIISTCHNLEPHYCSDTNRKEAYKVVYGKSDMILHLGNYSLNVMKERFPKANHVLLPHQIYDSIYDDIPDRNTACRKMGLNPKYKYIISFGAFRDDEERLLVKNLADKLKNSGVYFLAPAYNKVKKTGVVGRLLCKYEKTKHYYCNHIIMTENSNAPVAATMVPYYYAVADVALIQRKKILNSGNLPLAFLMKKVVVGPDVGNVGEWLKKTGNPTFNVNDDSTIIAAVRKGFDLVSDNYGEKNRRYASDNFSTAIIAERLYNYYLSLINDLK